MEIDNLYAPSGKRLVNQVTICDKNKTYLKSYNNIIASIDNETDEVELYNVSGYSNTMRKYLYQFLWESGRNDLSNRKKLDKAIKAGKVKVFDNCPEI